MTGQRNGQYFTEIAGESAQEDSDGQGHNPFMHCLQAQPCSNSNIGAIGIHVMNSVGIRYVDACSNDLLVIMTDAAPICAGNLLPVRYF